MNMVLQEEIINGKTEVLMGKMKERANNPISQDAKDWTIDFMECCTPKILWNAADQYKQRVIMQF